MKKRVSLIMVLAAAFVWSGAGSVRAGESLVTTLVRELGVTEKQASGGAGALLKHAKERLSDADFGKVASALPEVTSLVKAAPQGMGQGLGGGLGKSLQGLSGMAGVAKTFDSLGMKPAMVGKFVPTILSFAEGKGGASVMKILEGVLK